MSLPIFQTGNKDLTLLQNSWASQINPVLGNPSLSSIILKKVNLISGTTVVNHLLGRTLQGWKIVRQRSSAEIYDDQDTNLRPNLTLILVSNSATVVDIEVF